MVFNVWIDIIAKVKFSNLRKTKQKSFVGECCLVSFIFLVCFHLCFYIFF